MIRKVQIGLLGLGTVGTGVVKALRENSGHILSQLGVSIEINKILVKDVEKERRVEVEALQLITDGSLIVDDPEIDIVVEVMGGIVPAYTLVKKAMESGKHVVTANKELLAKRGQELLQLATDRHVHLLYEASVGGGIPVIRTLQAYLSANRVSSLRGILNGTCNYILTQMAEQGSSFVSALAQAQAAGFAEADPTNDVEGLDASYKLMILASMAFPVTSGELQVQRQGITEINEVDMTVAKKMDGVIKLVAEASYDGESVTLSVGPQMIPNSDPLARIRDEFNAVLIQADVVGDLLLVGKGAGERPTASAVIEDMMAILQSDNPRFRKPIDPWTPNDSTQQGESSRSWSYLRIKRDKLQEESLLEAVTSKFSSHGADERLPLMLHANHHASDDILMLVPVSSTLLSDWLKEKNARDWLVLPFKGELSYEKGKVVTHFSEAIS